MDLILRRGVVEARSRRRSCRVSSQSNGSSCDDELVGVQLAAGAVVAGNAAGDGHVGLDAPGRPHGDRGADAERASRRTSTALVRTPIRWRALRIHGSFGAARRGKSRSSAARCGSSPCSSTCSATLHGEPGSSSSYAYDERRREAVHVDVADAAVAIAPRRRGRRARQTPTVDRPRRPIARCCRRDAADDARGRPPPRLRGSGVRRRRRRRRRPRSAERPAAPRARAGGVGRRLRVEHAADERPVVDASRPEPGRRAHAGGGRAA